MYKLKEGKIGSKGIFCIVVVLLITKLYLGLPRIMVKEGASAAWLLIVMSAAIASIGVLIFVKLIQRFPGNTIIDISEQVWGTPGRLIVSVILSLFLVSSSAIIVREFSETMLTTVLPMTPISIVTLFFIIAIITGAYKGIEVIARSTILLFPFIIIGILSIIFLTINFVNFNNLFPVFGTGLLKLSLLAPGKSSMFIEIVIVGLLISSVSDPEKIPGQVWKGFFFSVLIFVIVEIMYVSLFGYLTGEELYVPLFQMARMIYMGRFIQRIEALYVFVWFFTGALQLTLNLYGAAIAFCRGFKIPIYQPVLFPLSLIIFTLSFVPNSIMTAAFLDNYFLRQYGAILGWGLPAALLFTAIVRKKGGRHSDQKKVA